MFLSVFGGENCVLDRFRSKAARNRGFRTQFGFSARGCPYGVPSVGII